ncbi:hypothetical protein Hanom_Chr05g00432451 [Helianthus anomalus]
MKIGKSRSISCLKQQSTYQVTKYYTKKQYQLWLDYSKPINKSIRSRRNRNQQQIDAESENIKP